MRIRAIALILTLTLALLTVPLPAEAQKKAGKVYRIGYLNTSYRAPYFYAFAQGLRELGYIDYKDFVIDRRIILEAAEVLPDVSAELVRLNVNLLVAVVC